MLTDVFSRRYDSKHLWTAYNERDGAFWFQVASLIVTEVLPVGNFMRDQTVRYPSMKEIVRRVAMEAGTNNLPYDKEYAWGFDSNSTYHDAVWTFLRMPPPVHESVDKFIKHKFSLVELVFRMVGDAPVAEPPQEKKSVASKLFFRKTAKPAQISKLSHSVKFAELVNELNSRLDQVGYPLSYNNGFIQIKQAGVIAQTISDPFWKLIEAEDWENVSIDMAEALDLRDNGGLNPALYAAKALESVIKVISDKKGWSTGNEKGAAAFIDNLVSQSNGRFISPWEADFLKLFFSKVRNPLGHGAGGSSMVQLTKEQDEWAIETCMSWIKSLINRL